MEVSCQAQFTARSDLLHQPAGPKEHQFRADFDPGSGTWSIPVANFGRLSFGRVEVDLLEGELFIEFAKPASGTLDRSTGEMHLTPRLTFNLDDLEATMTLSLSTQNKQEFPEGEAWIGTALTNASVGAFCMVGTGSFVGGKVQGREVHFEVKGTFEPNPRTEEQEP